MGTLFVVATPIGNLGDISERALHTLRDVDLIACEDTRHTIKLLNHFHIQKPLESYHDFNEGKKAQQLARRIAEGLNVAVVSDAGTPAISDPGYRLVRTCREQGIGVVAIPGANAALTALSASGLPSDAFMFVGFLPAKTGARRDRLEALRPLSSTLIFYEAPHRIEKTLEDLLDVLGDREACIAREITKLHEQYQFGRLAALKGNVKPVGEFVIVVNGHEETSDKTSPSLQGLSRNEVLRLLADKTGIPKNALYDALIKPDRE
jgi:16S rRNA (cytidine1402-2'-O)-methyltransferase